jgi:hypothetical protein
MRILSPFVLLIAAACAAAPAPAGPTAAASIPAGLYVLTAVGAKALPAESPTERGVTIWGGSLALEGGARYRLELRATPGDQAMTTATAVGAYRTAGDSLILTPDASAQAADPIRFRFAVAGALLRLHDKDGYEYTFSRR